MAARDRAVVSLEIESIYNHCTETSYIESAIMWAELNDVDLDNINDCIVEPLRKKIHNEAVNMRLLKDSTNCSSGSLDFLM